MSLKIMPQGTFDCTTLLDLVGQADPIGKLLKTRDLCLSDKIADGAHVLHVKSATLNNHSTIAGGKVYPCPCISAIGVGLAT